jgi:hypothetical protein
LVRGHVEKATKANIQRRVRPASTGRPDWLRERISAMFHANALFASLLWGSVGVGYFIYGKKQSSWVPMVGGLLMIVVSFFAGSALLMSLICLTLIMLTCVLLKRGY